MMLHHCPRPPSGIPRPRHWILYLHCRCPPQTSSEEELQVDVVAIYQVVSENNAHKLIMMMIATTLSNRAP